MPRIAAVRLRDRIAKELMLRVANAMRGTRSGQRAGFVAGPADVQPDEPEMELFMDWDAWRADGRGAYAHDPEECESRRVDLRGPLDRDPGPLPMEEAPEEITGKRLHLS